MPYKYEIHAHGMETSKCGHMKAVEVVRLLKEAGYQGVCFTDHFHSGWVHQQDCRDDWQACMERFLSGYHEAEEYGNKIDFDVILGAELRCPENNNDYLLYGLDEKWFRENPYVMQLSEREFFDKYGSELLIIQAHPYREGNMEVHPEYIHGIEIVNANPRHDNMNEKALELALHHRKLIRTCGSDVHRTEDVGYAGILVDHRLKDSKDLKRTIESGEYGLWCPSCEEIIRISEENK